MLEGRPVPWTRSEALLLVSLTAVAALLRIYAIGDLPLGVSHDEAYNGQDAIRVLEGFRPMFFAENNGREPLFIYAVACAFRAFGIGHLPLRAVAVLAGIAAVPLLYVLLRRLISPSAATFGALALAVCFPHLLASRLGLRAILLPPLELAALCFFWRGLQGEERWPWAVSGLLTGLALYTYPSARFFPLVPVVGFFAASLARRRVLAKWPSFVILVATALIAFAPLGVYFSAHPERFLGRAQQVDDLKFILDQGDFGPLWRDARNTLAMFSFGGDPSSRYNLAGRPVFDPLTSAFFYGGVVLAVVAVARRARHALAYGSLLIYAAVSLLPVAATAESPHFLRAIGAWPRSLRPGRDLDVRAVAGGVRKVDAGARRRPYRGRFHHGDLHHHAGLLRPLGRRRRGRADL